jgi:DNA polymerase-3 subunit beta
MNIVCSKESLLKALAIAENVISVKNTISILSNILFEAKENKIKIYASETKLNFIAEFGADISEEGATSINSNKFYSICKKLPGDEIKITLEKENVLNIQPKDKKNILYKIKVIDADKFPPIKTIESNNYFSISKEILSEMIKKTIFAISQNENRRFVNGIYFEKEENNIKMVSTDGKRLSFIRKTLSIESTIEKGIIIPFKILIETLKLCNGNGDVNIAIDSKGILIKIDNYTFISNLLEGSFPPYEKVIPVDQSISIIINKQELQETLERISQISDKETHKVTLSFSKNQLKINTEDITIGSGEESINIDYEGENFKIFLNYIFMLDVLSVMKSKNVIFEFKDPQSTVTVREENNDDFIYIMMPMTS